MHNYTRANGGGTFDHNGNPVEFSSGFMVGEIRLTVTSWDYLPVALEIGLGVLQELDQTHYLGTWVDEFGDIHVDISQYETDKDYALTLARDRGEIAIWNFASMADVLV